VWCPTRTKATRLGIQRALATGARDHILFHGWFDRVVGLAALFDSAEVVFQR